MKGTQEHITRGSLITAQITVFLLLPPVTWGLAEFLLAFWHLFNNIYDGNGVCGEHPRAVKNLEFLSQSF